MTIRERASDLQTIARRVVFIGVALGLSIGTAVKAEEFDGPRFQRGMWQFERTLAHVGSSPALPAATFMIKQQMERCVDPTEAMKETFRPTVIGSCRSVRPERIDNRYVFSLRCDFMGPARTVIEVESDSAYIEVNEFTSKPQKIETVTARRIGDCKEQNVVVLPGTRQNVQRAVAR
jgi:hypothetical protein